MSEPVVEPEPARHGEPTVLPPLVAAASDFFATIPMSAPIHATPELTIASGGIPGTAAFVKRVVIDLPDVYLSTLSVMQQNWDSVVVTVGREKYTYLGECVEPRTPATTTTTTTADTSSWSPAEGAIEGVDGSVPEERLLEAPSGFYQEQIALAMTHGGGPAELPDFPSWIPPLVCGPHRTESFFLLEEPLPVPGATTRDFAGRSLPPFHATPAQAAALGRDPRCELFITAVASCPGIVPARKDFVRGALLNLGLTEGPPPVTLPDGTTRPACGVRMTCTLMIDFGGGSPAVTAVVPPLIDKWIADCFTPYATVARWLQEAYGDKPVPFGDHDAFLLAVKMARDLSRRRGLTPPDHIDASCCTVQ